MLITLESFHKFFTVYSCYIFFYFRYLFIIVKILYTFLNLLFIKRKQQIKKFFKNKNNPNKNSTPLNFFINMKTIPYTFIQHLSVLSLVTKHYSQQTRMCKHSNV